MSVNVTWDNAEQTVLCFQFGDYWEWNEFQSAIQESQRFLASVGHIVDVIADFHDSPFVPTEALARLAYIGSPSPINLGSIVLVGSQAFSTTTLAIFRTFYGNMAQAFEVAHSMERGRALLAKAGIRYPAVQKMMFA
jgi:hypothetical protein